METSPILSNRLAPRVDPRSPISNPRDSRSAVPASSKCDTRDVSRSIDRSINCRFAWRRRFALTFYRRPDETRCRTCSPTQCSSTKRARARYPRFDRSTGSDRIFGSAVTIERKFSSLPGRFDEIEEPRRSLSVRHRGHVWLIKAISHAESLETGISG